jgi:transposase
MATLWFGFERYRVTETEGDALYRRTLAILEVAGGRPIAELARLLRTSRRSVHSWIESYEQARDPSCLADHRGGNHPSLWTEELQAALLADLAAQAGDDVLVRFELAAEAVVLAEVGVAGPLVAVDQQHALAVRRQEVAQRGEDRRVRHEESGGAGEVAGVDVQLVDDAGRRPQQR